MSHATRAFRRALVLLAFVAGIEPVAAATLARTFDGAAAGDAAGFAVAGAGDVDGDGVPDAIVGSYLASPGGVSSAGAATVYSGADGAVLYTFSGAATGDFFGRAVAGAGDVDGDAHADLMVGAHRADPNGPDSGAATLFSGADGAVIHAFAGISPGERFGYSVAGAGDVDGDQLPDVIVGAIGESTNGVNAGAAFVFSGVGGNVLHTFRGDNAEDRFGASVAGLGDADGDVYSEVIVGADLADPNGPSSGRARVFSGETGDPLYTLDGDSAGDFFGRAVAAAGDWNGDGFADFVVGAWGDDTSGGDAGSARVFNGHTGFPMATFFGAAPGDRFGFAVAGAGDVDGDGFADLAIGAPRADPSGLSSGSVRVIAGLTAVVLDAIAGPAAEDLFGASVAGAGDVDGDGRAEILVGAPFGDGPSGVDAGRATLLSPLACADLDGDGFGNPGHTTCPAGPAADCDDLNPAVNPAAEEACNAVDDDCDGDVDNGFAADGDGDGWSADCDCDDGNADVFPFKPESLFAPGAIGVDDNCNGVVDVCGALEGGDDGEGAWLVYAALGGLVLCVRLRRLRGAVAALGVAASLALAGTSRAEDPLAIFYGDIANSDFGYRVAPAGDVDGDDTPDLVVGARQDSTAGPSAGMARVLSGRTGEVLYTWRGNSDGDLFGASVAGVGDVNQDGFDDVAVGALADDRNGKTNNGSAWVFSGATGEVLYVFEGDSTFDTFGVAVAAVGDANADGWPDIAVSAPSDDNAGTESGMVRVFSGRDGSVLHSINGTGAGKLFGAALAGAGDVNGDAFADLLVGAPAAVTIQGYARVHSGADGSVLYTLTCDCLGDFFGVSVDGGKDVDGDGVPDLVVGARLDDIAATNAGSARVYSGASGALLYTLEGHRATDQFGHSVALVDDFNADGRADILVGSPDSNSGAPSGGKAEVFSGATGAEIFEVEGTCLGEFLGDSVADLGDLNGDGFADVAAGARYGRGPFTPPAAAPARRAVPKGGPIGSICGNGILEPGEECDDANTANCDGCNDFCFVETEPCACGNGIWEPENDEECDDGNDDPYDGCDGTCMESPNRCDEPVLGSVRLFAGRPSCVDADGDGYGAPGSSGCAFAEIDCDETDPNVNPGAPEACNGRDDDCDGTPDDGLDGDGDGWGAACDCDDGNPEIYPFKIENLAVPGTVGVDDNCNGVVDLCGAGGAAGGARSILLWLAAGLGGAWTLRRRTDRARR